MTKELEGPRAWVIGFGNANEGESSSFFTEANAEAKTWLTVLPLSFPPGFLEEEVDLVGFLSAIRFLQKFTS